MQFASVKSRQIIVGSDKSYAFYLWVYIHQGCYGFLRFRLVMQAQCILFSRYPEVLAPFKYAGYPMLLDAVTLPEDGAGSHFLGPDRAPQLQAGHPCGHRSGAGVT